MLYPVLLKWASQKRSTDNEVKNCWEAFTILKNRIMQTVDSENEGLVHDFLAFQFFILKKVFKIVFPSQKNIFFY